MGVDKESLYASLQKYSSVDRLFCQQLHALLAMNALVDGEEFEVPKFFIDRSDSKCWKLLPGKQLFSASSLVGSTEKINVHTSKEYLISKGILPDISQELFDNLLSEEEQQQYQLLFDDFLTKHINKSSDSPKENLAKSRVMELIRKQLGNINNSQHQTESDDGQEGREANKNEIRLLRDAYFALIHMLHKKNPSYISENGDVNAEGLQFLADVFNATKIYIGGHISKIFHDGDYRFLFEDDGRGNTKPYLLEHYAQAIKYLMNSEKKNLLYMNDKEGHSTRKRKKKAFVNQLFVVGQGDIEKIKIEKGWELSLHEKLANLWNATIKSTRQILPDVEMQASNRAKTQRSRQKKNLGRPTRITDESGVRITLFGDISPEDMSFFLYSTMEEYLHHIGTLSEMFPDLAIKINSIELDKTKDLISDEHFEHKGDKVVDCQCFSCKLQELHPDITIKRKYTEESFDVSLYEKLNLKDDPILQHCLGICLGKIRRGGNGEYKDVKIILELEVEGKPFYQEISVRHHSNEYGLSSPRFLAIEKDIFESAKNRNDEDRGMSVPLGSVIRFIETGVKGMSADADVAEKELMEKGLLEKTPPYYKEITINGTTYSLKGLIEKNEKTAKRIDEITCAILNYFIKENKLIFLNLDENRTYRGFIKPRLIYDLDFREQMRFLTSDTIKFMAEEPLFAEADIFVYYKPKNEGDVLKEKFYERNLGAIGRALFMLEQIQHYV